MTPRDRPRHPDYATVCAQDPTQGQFERAKAVMSEHFPHLSGEEYDQKLGEIVDNILLHDSSEPDNGDPS